MLTDLQKKKLSRQFKIYDVDKNGVLEEKDFAMIVQGLAKVRNWSEGSPGYENLRSGYMFIWKSLEKLADANRDRKVSLEEYLAYHETLLSSKENYEKALRSVAETVFNTVDVDGDGVVTQKEYEQFAAASRIDGPIAEYFKKMDRKGTGKITKDEVLGLVSEFYHSNDPNAPGNWFFGQY